MTPSEMLLHRWEKMSTPEPFKFPVRTVAELGGAMLSRVTSPDHVMIGTIWADEPRKGHGTTLIKKITDMADDLGVFLEVVPLQDQPWLGGWYETHGFTEKTVDGIAKLRRPRAPAPPPPPPPPPGPEPLLMREASVPPKPPRSDDVTCPKCAQNYEIGRRDGRRLFEMDFARAKQESYTWLGMDVDDMNETALRRALIATIEVMKKDLEAREDRLRKKEES